MTPFFIFGLPRSMTAWMANFLAHDKSFCFHELWADVETREEFYANIETMTLPFVGNSDPSNIAMIELITSRYPGASMVYLDRAVEDVNASLERLGFGPVPKSLLEAAVSARAHIKSVGGLVISVDDWSIEKARAVWNHCLPSTAFPVRRTQQLLTLNVQVTRERIRSYDRLGAGALRKHVENLWPQSSQS